MVDKTLQWLPPIVLSPSLLIMYILENMQQYSSQERDLLMQFSGAVVSIVILIVYRSYVQYVISFFIMLIVTVVLGHYMILEITLSELFTNFDGIFTISAFLEIFGAHLLSLICFSLLVKNGVLRKINKSTIKK